MLSTKPSIIPPIYQQLEYIKCNGTQWIDTGVRYYPNGIHAEIRVELLGNGQQYNPIIGTYLGINNGIYLRMYIYGKYNGKYQNGLINYFDNDVYSVGTGPQLLELCVFNRNQFIKINGEIKVRNSYEFTIPATKEETICVFFKNGDGTYGLIQTEAKLYNLKLFDDTGQLLRNLVPVRDIRNNAIGTYDTISKQFFGNSGTGEFIAGPNA